MLIAKKNHHFYVFEIIFEQKSSWTWNGGLKPQFYKGKIVIFDLGCF